MAVTDLEGLAMAKGHDYRPSDSRAPLRVAKLTAARAEHHGLDLLRRDTHFDQIAEAAGRWPSAAQLES